jgi:hypothetical protein
VTTRPPRQAEILAAPPIDQQRLEAILAAPAVVTDRPGPVELLQRGPVTVLLPKVVRADAPDRCVQAVTAVRSAWLADACAMCGARPHVVRRTGVIRVGHGSRCPGTDTVALVAAAAFVDRPPPRRRS